jgi:hypothetical protein
MVLKQKKPFGFRKAWRMMALIVIVSHGRAFLLAFPEIISLYKMELLSHDAILVKILFAGFFYEKNIERSLGGCERNIL